MHNSLSMCFHENFSSGAAAVHVAVYERLRLNKREWMWCPAAHLGFTHDLSAKPVPFSPRFLQRKPGTEHGKEFSEFLPSAKNAPLRARPGTSSGSCRKDVGMGLCAVARYYRESSTNFLTIFTINYKSMKFLHQYWLTAKNAVSLSLTKGNSLVPLPLVV